jgi:hypothetical protein
VKKLAIMFLSLAFTGGVAMACPHHEEKAADDNAPKTAEKAKTEKKQDDKAKADKTKTAKPAEKTTEKKPEKVSKK